jgi:hypothetical protein
MSVKGKMGGEAVKRWEMSAARRDDDCAVIQGANDHFKVVFRDASASYPRGETSQVL